MQAGKFSEKEVWLEIGWKTLMGIEKKVCSKRGSLIRITKVQLDWSSFRKKASVLDFWSIL